MNNSTIIAILIATVVVIVVIVIALGAIIKSKSTAAARARMTKNVDKSAELSLALAQLQLQLAQAEELSGYVDPKEDPVISSIMAQITKLTEDRAKINTELLADTTTINNQVVGQINSASQELVTISSQTAITTADQKRMEELKAEIAELEKQAAALAEQSKTVAESLGTADVCGGKSCGPKGTLDSSRCTCSCIDGYTGLLCSVPPPAQLAPIQTGNVITTIQPTTCTVGFKGPPACVTRDYSRVHALNEAQQEFICKGSWTIFDSMNMGTRSDPFILTPSTMPGNIEHLFADGWFRFNRDSVEGCPKIYGNVNYIDTKSKVVTVPLNNRSAVVNSLRLPPNTLYEIFLRRVNSPGVFIVPGWPKTAGKAYAVGLIDGTSVSYIGYSPPLSADLALLTHKYYDILNGEVSSNETITRVLADIEAMIVIQKMRVQTVLVVDIISQLTAFVDVLKKIQTIPRDLDTTTLGNVASVLSQVVPSARSEGFEVGSTWKTAEGNWNTGMDQTFNEFENVPVVNTNTQGQEGSRELINSQMVVPQQLKTCSVGYMSAGDVCVPDYTVQHALTQDVRMALCRPIANMPPVIVGKNTIQTPSGPEQVDWYFTPYMVETSPFYNKITKQIEKLFPDGWFIFKSQGTQPYCKNINAFGILREYDDNGNCSYEAPIIDSVRPQYTEDQVPSMLTLSTKMESGVVQVSKYYTVEIFGKNESESVYWMNIGWKRKYNYSIVLADGYTLNVNSVPAVSQTTYEILNSMILYPTTIMMLSGADASSLYAKINNEIANVSGRFVDLPGAHLEVHEKLLWVRDNIGGMYQEPDVPPAKDPLSPVNPNPPPARSDNSVVLDYEIVPSPQTTEPITPVTIISKPSVPIATLYSLDKSTNTEVKMPIYSDEEIKEMDDDKDSKILKFDMSGVSVYAIYGNIYMMKSYPQIVNGKMYKVPPLLNEDYARLLMVASKLFSQGGSERDVNECVAALNVAAADFQVKLNAEIASGLDYSATRELIDNIIMVKSMLPLIQAGGTLPPGAPKPAYNPTYGILFEYVRTTQVSTNIYTNMGMYNAFYRSDPLTFRTIQIFHGDGRSSFIVCGWDYAVNFTTFLDGKRYEYSGTYSEPLDSEESRFAHNLYKSYAIGNTFVPANLEIYMASLRTYIQNTESKQRIDTYTRWLKQLMSGVSPFEGFKK